MSQNLLTQALSIFRIIKNTKRLRRQSSAKDNLIAKKALLNQFTDARGSIMKFGQLLASANNQSDDELTPLLKGIPAKPLRDIAEQLELSIEQPIKVSFLSIDESKSAASLGQVHHAILKTGEEVAVKIQYPDITEKINAEIKLFQLMPGMGSVRKWGFDLESYKQCFKTNMDRELDYNIEAHNQKIFAEKIQIKGLIVPSIYPLFSKQNLLVQSWEQGVYLDEVKQWPKQDRQKIAEIILATLLKSLFEAGMVHGDPHLGNSYYRYNDKQQPEVILLDYGCIIETSEIERLSLLKLILSAIEKTDTSPIRYFSALGFDPEKLLKIGDALPIICTILFEPFTTADLFHIKNWKLESRFDQILQERRWWFRSAGPAQLILIMRAFQGVVQQLQILETSISWSKILFQTISQDTLDKARSLELPKIPQEQLINIKSINALATSLRIRILNNGQRTANITLPAEMALELESLIPPDILNKLNADPMIDFKQIKENIRDSGIAPQNLFSFENKAKNYAVWLE